MSRYSIVSEYYFNKAVTEKRNMHEITLPQNLGKIEISKLSNVKYW